jgi:hypothetical protein
VAHWRETRGLHRDAAVVAKPRMPPNGITPACAGGMESVQDKLFPAMGDAIHPLKTSS